MSMSKIQGHLEEIYQTEISKDLISTITDGVIDEVTRWQNRPLDSVYPILYLDCIHVKSRDNNIVINKAVYLAIAVNIEGKKELLGIWIDKNKGVAISGCRSLQSLRIEGLNKFMLPVLMD